MGQRAARTRVRCAKEEGASNEQQRVPCCWPRNNNDHGHMTLSPPPCSALVVWADHSPQLPFLTAFCANSLYIGA